MLLMLTDVHSLGLKAAQGTFLTIPSYWNTSDAARAFTKKFQDRLGKAPTFCRRASTAPCATTCSRLRPPAATSPDAVMAKFRTLPIDDAFSSHAHLRADGLVERDMLLAQIKTPAESRARGIITRSSPPFPATIWSGRCRPANVPWSRSDGAAMTGIARFGSFYVGGRDLVLDSRPSFPIAFTDTARQQYNPNGLYHVEQAYVQYFEPAEPSGALPVVFLHGGGMAGVMWSRPRTAAPVGRSTSCMPGSASTWSTTLSAAAPAGCRSMTSGPARPSCAMPRRRGPCFASATPPSSRSASLSPGSAFRWRTCRRWPRSRCRAGCPTTLAIQTFAAVLQRIGPCTVVAHSHGGYIALKAACLSPGTVQNMVLVEGSGFPAQDELPLLRGTSFLFVYGDYLDATPLWCDLVQQAKTFRQGFRRRAPQPAGWSCRRKAFAATRTC
jgi:pimeloyl-ACP methyl ester carboxylesterase